DAGNDAAGILDRPANSTLEALTEHRAGGAHDQQRSEDERSPDTHGSPPSYWGREARVFHGNLAILGVSVQGLQQLMSARTHWMDEIGAPAPGAPIFRIYGICRPTLSGPRSVRRPFQGRPTTSTGTSPASCS